MMDALVKSLLGLVVAVIVVVGVIVAGDLILPTPVGQPVEHGAEVAESEPAEAPPAEEASEPSGEAPVQSIADAAHSATEAADQTAETAAEATREGAEALEQTGAETRATAEETAPVVPETAASPAAETAAAPEASPALAMVASADPAAGEKKAKVCSACHTFNKGGPARTGPNLWGVVGREKASFPDFKYSDAIAGLGGSWTWADLDAYLTNPRSFAPGNRMGFAGLKKDEERAAVLAYLHSLSDSPVPLP